MATPITNTEQLQAYLTKKDIPCSTAEALTPLDSGANFVWRVTTLLGRTSVVKHAEPYVKGNSSVAFPVDRMDFEAKALKELPKYIPEDEMVAPAKFLRYDDQAHVLSIEDAGSKNLKEAYEGEDGNVVRLVGEALGRWIARLHDETKGEEVRKMFDNKTVSTCSTLNDLGRYLQSRTLVQVC
jgi:5-methylthioribose kinase